MLLRPPRTHNPLDQFYNFGAIAVWIIITLRFETLIYHHIPIWLMIGKDIMKKAIAATLSLSIIASLTLFITGILNPIYFWLTAIVASIFAFWILPRWK